MQNDMPDFLNKSIKNLLHLEEGLRNRLVDLGDLSGNNPSRCNSNTYLLTIDDSGSGEIMLNTIRERRGKPSNQTVLAKSSLADVADTGLAMRWSWKNLQNDADAEQLHGFIDNYYKELNLQGNNPLFLSVGAIKWKILIKGELTEVNSPVLIFPVRLNRGAEINPVEIEFVDDDAYFNPCLIALLREIYPKAASNFPHPNGRGAQFDEAVDLDKLSDGAQYFQTVERYLAECVNTSAEHDTMVLDKDAVCLALYKHSDICMYYDVHRNMERIRNSVLVSRIFNSASPAEASLPPQSDNAEDVNFILPRDSIQENLIRRVARGESLIIKGPPGTGKTLTIANMIAALMAQNKRILFASKKISALSEVSKKLPESLRKFVLMLAYETEKEASAVSPNTLRQDFRNILRYKKEYTFDRSAIVKLNSAYNNRLQARKSLVNYIRRVFGEFVFAGKNYYDALDAFYATDLPLFALPDSERFSELTGVELELVKSLANEAGKHFAKLCGSGHAKYSPWYNIKGTMDVDGKIYPVYSEICDALRNVFPTIQKAERIHGINLESYPVEILTVLAGQSVFGTGAVQAICNLCKLGRDDSRTKEFVSLTESYLSKLTYAHPLVAFDEGVPGNMKRFASIGADATLTVEQLRLINKRKGLFYRNGEFALAKSDAEELLKTVDRIDGYREKAHAELLQAIAVFDKPLTDKQSAFVLNAYEKLKNYQNGDKIGMGLKGLVKKLNKLSSDKLFDIEKAVRATVAYRNYVYYDNDADRFMLHLKQILGSPSVFTEEDYAALSVALRRCNETNTSLQQYIETVSVACAMLDGKDVRLLSDSVTVDSVIKAYELFELTGRLQSAVEQICADACIELPKGELAEVARAVCGAMRLGGYEQIADAEDELLLQTVSALNDLDKTFSDDFNRITKLLSGLKGTVVNYYTERGDKLTLSDLYKFANQATDRGVIGSAIKYGEAVDSICQTLPLRELFRHLENGDCTVPADKFADFVEHNCLYKVIGQRVKQMGNSRNGLGHHAIVDLEKYDAADREILQLNIKLTEQACLAPIDPDDDDFDFLANEKGVRYTMRGMFNRCSSAIWKLKRCFVLSPSSASVLLRNEIYNNFDVVIVDEASQLEPVYLLPLLFRSKQCVLVGDEFQMPPITHFKTVRPDVLDNPDSDLKIPSEISALSLALSSNAFDYEELICHYRSNTESLIAFSQKRFYPHMRTFPAARPFGEGLGFRDEFVEGGFCDNGKNYAEVARIVQLLQEHFDRYFDEESGALRSGGAVGVVAFGEAQSDAIFKQVEADSKLFDRIQRAQSAVDVPEKAVFFRTIESVQGQETDHLILSLTYGRDPRGNVQNRFGELNRDELGSNIFNVAVTRARNSVTLVHSVQPHELSSPRIDFIVEYMRLVQRYSQNDRQFVGSKSDKGGHFVENVVEYIKSLNVDERRIVTGYGVTDGSVRIPIAILSPDLQEAQLGIWCELPTEEKYNYLDYNLLYYNNLSERGWKLHRIPIHEWFDNNEAEKQRLKNIISELN